jgi:hypothetical protein
MTSMSLEIYHDSEAQEAGDYTIIEEEDKDPLVRRLRK